MRRKFQRRFLRPLRHLKRNLGRFAGDVLYDRRHDWGVRVLAPLLWGLSVIFRVAVTCRHWFYRCHLFRSHRLKCLVIGVGNLTLGGTGKTPVVEYLARELTRRGHRVAILSRGYKSKSESWWRPLFGKKTIGPRVVSDGKQLLLDAEVAGDEPFMLAKNLKNVVVITHKDRLAAGRFAIQNYNCDTLILDDGFQYRKLRGQISILLVDKSNPVGNGYLIPRGILREPVTGMRRATHIFFTKSDGKPNSSLDLLLKKYKRTNVPIIESCHRPQYLCAVDGCQRVPVETLLGKRVAIFSGIAQPENFESFIRAAGATIVFNRRFPDHHNFSREEVLQIYERSFARQAEMVITTEKDAVRLPHQWLYPLPSFYLRIDVQILAGHGALELLLSQEASTDEVP
jgi:tetraacyldisaccharide 4'-kinase